MVEVVSNIKPIAGIVLAGGKARRLGGDKAFRMLGGKPLLAHALDRAGGQATPLAISANDPPARFAAFGLPVLPDTVEGFVGPLAGILAGMAWAEKNGIADLASFTCDAPFFPRGLVAQLAMARDREGATVACAASGGRLHPVFALWPVSLRADLHRALAEEGLRKVGAWAARYPMAMVEFPAVPFDPFFNVNMPEDLARAETLLAGGTSVDNGSLDRVGKS